MHIYILLLAFVCIESPDLFPLGIYIGIVDRIKRDP